MDYTIQDGILKVVISSKGAEVQSVKDRHNGYEYIWQANPKVWARHAPVLFPIVGRLVNDEYTYKGKKYHMTEHALPEIKNLRLNVRQMKALLSY